MLAGIWRGKRYWREKKREKIQSFRRKAGVAKVEAGRAQGATKAYEFLECGEQPTGAQKHNNEVY